MSEMLRKKKKTVIYNIQCVVDKNHEFDREFVVEDGSEEKYTTEVQIYCPFCHNLLTVTVDGKILSDTSVFRSVEKV